jgi:hypothetical protein
MWATLVRWSAAQPPGLSTRRWRYYSGFAMQDTQGLTHRFRFALAYLWAWAGSAHLLLLAVLITGVYAFGRDVDRSALICLAILPLAYWVVYGLKFRLTVSPSGLGWVNRTGVSCFLPWAEIKRAERQNQLGLPFLAIWSETCSSPYSFPICVAHRDKMLQAVRLAADDAHPVALALSDCPVS